MKDSVTNPNQLVPSTMAGWKFLLILVLPTAAGAVLNIFPSSHRALAGSDVLLPCKVDKTSQNPKPPTVIWYFQDKKIVIYDKKVLYLSPRASFNGLAANMGDASLSLANVSISDEGLYRCRVIYQQQHKDTRVILEVLVPPVIFIPNKVIQKNKENTLICTANGFYPEDIDISWYKDNEPLTNSQFGKPERNPDGTYRVMGTVTLPPMDGKMDHNFSCKVQHASLQQPHQEHFHLEYEEFPWRPQMGEIINPDTLIHSKEGKFQCKIWGYFPDALEVKWLRREAGGQELFSVCPSEKYKIPEMEQKREADGTFSCTVSLIVSVSLTTEQGAEFICRVGHPSLGEPLERSTGILSVRRAPVINITHEGDKIRAEIDQFYPQNIGVIWSRTKNIKDVTFKECEASRISNETHSNSDGTYRIISSCDTKKPSDKKHIKLHVTHEALGNPIEKIFIREKGKYYEQQGDKNILLQKHPE